MLRGRYTKSDFDFAIVYLDETEVFYVFPVEDFVSDRSGIHLVEAEKRQRKPRSSEYRNAWHLLNLN